MGSSTIKNIISKLDGDIEFINRERLSKLTTLVIKKYQELTEKQQSLRFQQRRFMPLLS